MNNNMTDLDPLSTYDYSYGYDQIHNMNYAYPYNVKPEPIHDPNTLNNLQQALSNINAIVNQNIQSMEVAQNTKTDETNNTDKEDTKDDLKLLLGKKRHRKPKTGKTSSYWNQKIEDKNFPFYGCTICNISFATTVELDQHVTMHKGRLTSYDLRQKNQLKRKLMKKEKKREKKLGKKIKKENIVMDIEIKPEDGYIGNEKASEFLNNEKSQSNNENELQNNDSQNENKSNNEKNHENHDKNPETNDKKTENNDKKSETNDKKSEKHDKKSEKHDKKSEKHDKKPENNDKNGTKESEDPRLEKLFKCFACQKQFSLLYYLKLHVRSHTDEKPYTCAECGQSFITASKLGRHNKRIHLAIRYQCRICYRFFSRFEYLTRHFDKKHPEDKLEGEPYDYNAILPYLKELEEQLREKSEEKEKKPKTEDLWVEWSSMDQVSMDQVSMDQVSMDQVSMDQVSVNQVSANQVSVNQSDHITKDEPDSKYFSDQPVPLDIIIEVEHDVKIKEEKVDEPEGDDVKVDILDVSLKEDHHGDSFKDESVSDEDYFPTNTWAATPKLEPGPASPSPKKKRVKDNRTYPLKCEFCEKTINSKSYMRVHLRTHTGEKPFKCYICNRGFITASKLHRHVLTHAETWGDGDNQVKIEEEVKMENDEENKDGDKKRMASIKKAKARLNMKKIKANKKDYKKRPFACMFCHQRFLHNETMTVHMKSHEGEELILKCSFCLEVMPDQETLATHEATHTGKKPYLCTVCGRCYTKKETMIYHRKVHSSDKKKYICDVCSKTFNEPCKLQRHLVSHRVEKFVLRYECPVCAHMFNTKYHIQMHLTTHQKEGLILEENRSEILAMVLQNARKIPKKSDAPANDNLTDLIPADERSRVCNICGQVFQHFYYLEEHLKSHGSKIAIEDIEKNEEKKHICNVCNKGFKLHYYLKLHSYTHTKEKPYICQQCGKGFITKQKLKRHLETHTGLKKYQCHICYKFFTRPSYLRIHVRTIHGTQDYNFKTDKSLYDMQIGHFSV